ncbi:MAG: hypothetical protein KDC48_07695, partial [Planctomycetes bacterium]|nr:hypothetical protein [Planctomycetota bacterium]
MADAETDPIQEEPSTDPVDALLGEVLGTPEAQWPASVAALCEQFPEHASALRRRFACLQSHGIVASSTPSLPGSGSRFGDYDLGQLLGHGAMGVVFDAL